MSTKLRFYVSVAGFISLETTSAFTPYFSGKEVITLFLGVVVGGSMVITGLELYWDRKTK